MQRPGEAGIGDHAAREQRPGLGDAVADHALDGLEDASGPVAAEAVLGDHLEAAAAGAERHEPAVPARVLDRELDRLRQQPVHVRGVAEQPVGLVERAELVAGGERDRHVLLLQLAPQGRGARLGVGIAGLAQPQLGLLEQGHGVIEVLALALEPRQHQHGLGRQRQQAQLAEQRRGPPRRVGHRIQRHPHALPRGQQQQPLAPGRERAR